MTAGALRHPRLANLAAPGVRCVAVALTVAMADQASKLLAAARLDGVDVPLAGDAFLTLVHNDTFARGMALGGATLPATLLLSVALLLLVARACTPLAQVDRAAPLGLGLVAGATIGNAVDFIGVHTAEGALVFNLADVAAYAGVALLAHSTWRISRHIRAERALTSVERVVATTAPEVVQPLPLFVEPGVAAREGDVRESVVRTPERRVARDP
jgi:lipoprotein signal peptidase